MRLSSCLVIVYLHIQCILGQDKYTDEDRPYKFGFNIEGYQHRQEEKDDKGLIKGEYGFITADGYYRVTVYATDENGSFRIISMKNYYVGFPPEDPQTTPQPPNQPGQGFTLPPRSGVQPNPLSTPVRGQEKAGRKEKDPIELTGLTACSDCLIPTTKKPGVATRFGGGRGGGSPGFGTRTQGGGGGGGGGQGFGGGSGGDSPVFGARTRGNTGGGQGGFGGSGGGRGNDGGAPGSGGGFGGGPAGGSGFGGAPGSGGAPGGRDTPRGSARFVGTGGDGSTGRGGGRGQFQGDSPNRGGTGGVSTPGRPEVGTVRDGLPRGVSMDDIKALLYTFNYTVGFHGHHEDGYRNGDKEGDYFFDGRDGVERKVEYIANEFGYQPNITFIDLPENDVRRPKEETEKEYGLKGYEFKWFYRK